MTDTTTPSDATVHLVDTYLDVWRADDEAARRSLLEQTFVPDGRHVDPMADAVGYDDLAAMLAGVHAMYPGLHIERTSGVDRHGDQLRFTWRLDAADGATVAAGLDVAEVAPDGRFARIASFWGELPPR